MANKRGLKNRYQLSNSLDNKLYVGLELLHRKSRIDKSKYLDEAVEDLLKKYNLIVDPQDPEVQEIAMKFGITLGNSTK
ncbi:ribbon-helix-helix domain-containing protein [Paenibacillus validus]|uniref:Ribbon-helix-helix domain-containing protein n=1 Tax=Paenibacillus validus TaxID=44253 RepID=A0A7X2Z754_9BACL|nr:ribbon-helix-helix domain-containing protein [Paenibacillus validus]MUG69528.1 ribbon-helix-helix domain-containing protein [Paenibacillus validus]